MSGVIPVLVLAQTLEVVVGDNMREIGFSKYHPVVNIVFFIGAFAFTVILLHPVYLLTGLLLSTTYYLLLIGRKGWINMWKYIKLLIFLTLINPLLNTRGKTVLFVILGRPYTYEALVYGVVVSTIFVVMLIWLGCYNKVLTGDKFTCVFSNLLPIISLLLVMVFRLVPNYLCKLRQILGARKAIGKGTENGNTKVKIVNGMTGLGVLTSLALENSVVTGDSMKARGYGTGKRSSFMIYHMTKADWTMLFFMLCMIVIVIGVGVKGGMAASFIPEIRMASIGGINVLGYLAYCGFLLVPVLVHIKEILLWNISKYKI